MRHLFLCVRIQIKSKIERIVLIKSALFKSRKVLFVAEKNKILINKNDRVKVILYPETSFSYATEFHKNGVILNFVLCLFHLKGKVKRFFY